MKDLAFAALKTLLVLPWTAFTYALAFTCIVPLALMMTIIVSEDFDDWIQNLKDFYFDHIYCFSGLESVVEAWKLH